MADKIICKSNVKLKFLYRQTKNVNIKTKKLLTSALILYYFDYAWFLINAQARTHIGLREFRLVNMLPIELRVKQLKMNLA